MIVLLDTVTPSSLIGTPKSDAVAGYVGGNFADFETLKRDFPGRQFLSYAVNNQELADFCDCENGDLTPGQVLPWLKWAHSKGVWRPGFYASKSVLIDEGLQASIATKLPRSAYRIIGALWNSKPDIPFGWDGHQYSDHGPNGQNYDRCVVRDDFFPHTDAPVQRLRRIWTKPVTASIQFDTQTGRWQVHGT